MRIEHRKTRRGEMLIVTCHDAPIMLGGQRYKKLIISAIDLWLRADGVPLDREAREIYDHRYELMVFHMRGKLNWIEVCYFRSHSIFNLDATLKDIIRGKYAQRS